MFQGVSMHLKLLFERSQVAKPSGVLGAAGRKGRQLRGLQRALALELADVARINGIDHLRSMMSIY